MATAMQCYKLVIVGDAATGKTQLMSRFCNDEFTEESMTTIGVEYQNKILKLFEEDSEKENLDVKLQIWDTAGQERFRSIARSVYNGSRGVMIVYDVSRAPTFEHIPTWLEELRTILPHDTTMLLIGNKCDLEEQREVKKEDADRFAKENNLIFFETSAKDNTNVTKAFEWLAKKIYEQTEEVNKARNNNGNTQQQQQQSNSNSKVPASGRVSLKKTPEDGTQGSGSSGSSSGGSGGKCSKC